MPANLQIRVVNARADRVAPEGTQRVYIGRPSVLGNPWVIGRHGSRDEVIARYRELIERVSADTEHPVTREITRLRALAGQGAVELACYCAPAPCHGDVIAEHILKG